MNFPGLFEVNPERLTIILEQHHQVINENWVSAMRQKWTGWAERKLSCFEQKIADDQDLFSVLRACSGKTEAYYQHIAPLINLDLITSQEYSILDLFDEAVSLKDSILKLLHKLKISEDERERLIFVMHEQIFALVQGLLCGTKELLSCLVEGGMRGYCQVDEQGRIEWADQEFQRLLRRKVGPDERLEELFVERDRDFFADVFKDSPGTPPGPQQLHLDSRLEKPIPVGTEVCPIVMDGRRRGWYACLVDLSAIQKKELEVYENLPVGLAQVDLKGKFRYANSKFLEILELENQDWQDKTIWDFLPDEENRKKVESEIEKRRHGIRSAYEVTFTRESGYQVPVKIYAVPEKDLKGKVIGSLAIVRSLEWDKAIARMHEHMTTAKKWQDMLPQVIREVKPFIPYDLCIVSEISSDQRHLRRLLSEPGLEDRMPHAFTRWEVPDEMQQWFKEQKDSFYHNDLEDFLSKNFPKVKERPEIQWLIQEGYRSFIRLPIIQEQPVASMSFLSKTKAYDETHREMIEALPVDKAVRLALYRQGEEEFKFRFELIKKVSVEEKDFRKVAQILVEELADHYGWGNVALYRADTDFERFFLIYQKNSPGTPPIPEGYEQPLDKGVLGYVYRTGEDINIGNVTEDLRFKDIYVSPWKTKGSISEKNGSSEICLRLKTDNACFLLNIEDPIPNAFSEEELKALQVFRDEAREILERSWLYHSLNAALQSTSDAVISTDRKGRITRVNRAAALLLGYTEEEMQEQIWKKKEGLLLKGYFQDAKVAENAIKDRYFPSQEVIWVNRAKEPVNVLLSASALPDELGGKIFTAKNLAERDRVEQLEHLGKLYQDIAIQMKTPLSLAFVWLKRLVQKDPQSEEAKTLGRVIKQLHKVDLTFDRLSLYDYDEQEGWFPTHKLLLSLKEVLRNVEEDLPESDLERILYHSPRPLPTLRGDLFQLTFCVETILTHLLGVIPEDERVQVEVSSHDNRIVMEFSAVYPEIQESQLSRALTAIALGENIIHRFMANNGGEYQKERDGSRMIFRLALSAA
jgi:PAS domain S-box-containing protein